MVVGFGVNGEWWVVMEVVVVVVMAAAAMCTNAYVCLHALVIALAI